MGWHLLHEQRLAQLAHRADVRVEPGAGEAHVLREPAAGQRSADPLIHPDPGGQPEAGHRDIMDLQCMA